MRNTETCIPQKQPGIFRLGSLLLFFLTQVQAIYIAMVRWELQHLVCI